MDTAPIPTQPAAMPEPVHTQPPEPTQHQVHPEHQPHTAAADYPSNPVATAKIAFAKFWHNTKQSLLGNIGLQILVFIGMMIAIGLIVLAGLAVLINIVASGSTSDVAQLKLLVPQQLLGMFSGGALVVWLILGVVGLVGVTLLATLLQAIQFATVTKAIVHNQATTVGEVMKLAGSKLWPLLGQAFFISLVVIGISLVFLLLIGGSASGLISGNQEAMTSAGAGMLGVLGLGLLLFVVAMWIAPRLCLAPLAVVAENVGPIAAFKHSWHMTKGHYWEMIGVLAVASTLSTLLSFLTDIATTLLASSIVGLIVVILFFAFNLIVVLFASAAIGERYLQLRNVPANHTYQTGANIGVFALAIVIAIATSSIQSFLLKKTNEVPTLNYPELNQSTDDSTLPSYDDSDYPPADATDEEFEQYLRQKYPELYENNDLPTQAQ